MRKGVVMKLVRGLRAEARVDRSTSPRPSKFDRAILSHLCATSAKMGPSPAVPEADEKVG